MHTISSATLDDTPKPITKHAVELLERLDADRGEMVDACKWEIANLNKRDTDAAIRLCSRGLVSVDDAQDINITERGRDYLAGYRDAMKRAAGPSQG